MLKRILLIAGTLVILLGSLLVYYQFAGGEAPETPPPPRMPHHGGKPTGTPEGGIPATGHKVAAFSADRETGRRTGKYVADKWDKTAGRVILTNPRVELYRKRGQTIFIAADSATIEADEAGGTFNPRKGKLVGNVHIRIDRNPAFQKPPAAERPDDFVHIHVERMDFDNDLLEIIAKSKVKVLSKEARIFGEDLTLRWDTDPFELRMLRLAKGERLIIPAGRKGFGRLLPSGPDKRKDHRATAPAEARPTRATASPAAEKDKKPQPYRLALSKDVRLQGVEQSMEGCEELELLFTYQPGSSDEDPLAQPTARKAATTKPVATATTTQPAEEEVVITWSGPLEMKPYKAGNGRPAPPARKFYINAAGEELSLGTDTVTAKCGRFDFDSDRELGRLFSRRTTPVSLQFGDDNLVTGKTIVLDRKAETIELDGPGTMDLNTPRTEEASANAAMAANAAIAANDATAATVAADAAVEDKNKTIHIRWTEGVDLNYATLDRPTAKGESSVYPTLAVFRGKASFTQADGAALTANRLEVSFGPPKTPTAAELAKLAGEETDMFADAVITHVLATGDVKLIESGRTDTIHAKRLDVTMGVSRNGQPFPLKAVATGGAWAQQGASRIDASQFTATFREATAEEAGADDVRYVPVRLLADGGVVLTDDSDATPMQATGRTLDSDLRTNLSTLTGDPATVRQGDQEMLGAKIVLRMDADRELVSATIPGDGAARLMLTEGPNGIKYHTPKPAIVKWAKEMTFVKEGGRLVLDGDVQLDSGFHLANAKPTDQFKLDSLGDHLRCASMEIVFVPTPKPAKPTTRPAAATRPTSRPATRPAKPTTSQPATQPAKQPATQPATRPAKTATSQPAKLATTRPAKRPAETPRLAALGTQRVKTVTADTNVKMVSRWHDAEGLLFRRMQIESRHLLFNATARQITAKTPGSLSAEDYRPPKPEKKTEAGTASRSTDSVSIGRPSQTLLRWSRSLQLRRQPTYWSAELAGGVELRHRSGGKIVGIDTLPIPKYPKLGKGRELELYCQDLTAHFERKKPTDKPATSPGKPTKSTNEQAESAGAKPTTSDVTTSKPAESADATTPPLKPAKPDPVDPADSLALTLELFDARGRVYLRDGPYEAVGHRVLYNRKDDTVVIQGNPKRKTNAVVYYEDPYTGVASRHESPEITVRRVNGRVQIRATRGTGGGTGG